MEPPSKKPRKALSEEALEKLSQARLLANKKRKEMSEQRKLDKEALVQQKIEEAKSRTDVRLEKQAEREAKKRLHTTICKPEQEPEPVLHAEEDIQEEATVPEPIQKSRRQKVVVEYSSDSDDDVYANAKVLFVKKERPKEPTSSQVRPLPTVDPLMGAYNQMFGRF